MKTLEERVTELELRVRARAASDDEVLDRLAAVRRRVAAPQALETHDPRLVAEFIAHLRRLLNIHFPNVVLSVGEEDDPFDRIVFVRTESGAEYKLRVGPNDPKNGVFDH